LKETVESSLADESHVKSLHQTIEDKMRVHLAEKDRQIQLLEKEIISIKQKEQYYSNSSTS
jgi:hypothetical protein